MSTRLLLHPLVLLSLLLWALNDHVLKAAYPGWTTGKLSDLSAMVAAPILLFAWVELLAPRFTLGCRSFVMIGSALTCAATLSFINLSVLGADLYRSGFAMVTWPFWALVSDMPMGHPLNASVVHVMDPSDALAAPLAVIPVLLASRTWR